MPPPLPAATLRQIDRRGAAGEAGEASLAPTTISPMSGSWTVPLPADAFEPFEVYVNGVRQERGVDYTVEGQSLCFGKPLAKEGRLGLARWASMFLGIAGTYRKNDTVDVVYTVGGRRTVASDLPIIPPSEAPG